MNIMLPSSDETGEIRLVFDTVSPYYSDGMGMRLQQYIIIVNKSGTFILVGDM